MNTDYIVIVFDYFVNVFICNKNKKWYNKRKDRFMMTFSSGICRSKHKFSKVFSFLISKQVVVCLSVVSLR